MTHGSMKLSHGSLGISLLINKNWTAWVLIKPLLTSHRIMVRLCSWMKKAALSSVICEGVCLLWTQCSYVSASMPCSHIVSALKASCHACLIRGKNRHSEVPQSWQKGAMHFLEQWNTFCFTKMLILCHFYTWKIEIFANDQTHLQKQAKNRRAPPQHLLLLSLWGFPGDFKD